MKWNWGTGIFLFIVIFLCACAAFFIYAKSLDWSLVDEDYYPKELRHEEVLVKMRNVNALKEKLLVNIVNDLLVIRFPADLKGDQLQGIVFMYRPSDKNNDLTLPIATDTALSMSIPLNRFVRGKYVLKTEWTAGNKGYYQETVIFIP